MNVSDVPGKLTELIPTLSLTVALNVTDWLWELVERETVLSLTVNEVITGACVSFLVIVILRDFVDKFPASSAATYVKVSVVSPKL